MTFSVITEQFFHQTVVLFEWLCAQTGLSYALLNILVYCLLIPGLWTIILCIRKGWFRALWLAVFAAVAGGYALVSIANIRQLSFYDRQISLLYKTAHQEEASYMTLSVIIGIVVPGIVTAALLLIPGRFLLPFYITVHAIVALFLGYGWMRLA